MNPSDPPTSLTRKRYLDALEQEDMALAATIAAIRGDQKAGRLTDAQAAANIEAIEELHARNCAQRARTYKEDS